MVLWRRKSLRSTRLMSDQVALNRCLQRSALRPCCGYQHDDARVMCSLRIPKQWHLWQGV
eukprot:4771611-Amphidinium_carterae.1